MKKPPTAHTRLTLDFCKYLLPLQLKENKENEEVEEKRERMKKKKKQKNNRMKHLCVMMKVLISVCSGAGRAVTARSSSNTQ